MKRAFFLLVVPVFLHLNSHASHLMGGEITWECQGNGEFIFTMKLYRDCNGINGPSSTTLQVHYHPSISSIPLTLISQADISPQCAGGGPSVTCSGGGTGATEEFIYRSAPIQLSGTPPAGGWWFTFDSCCRNGAIDNLVSPSSQGFTLRAAMHAYNGQNMYPCFDSSPAFEQIPTSVVCTGSPYTFNHNAADTDLDSLVFYWAKPLDDFSGTFNPPANPNELAFSSGYSYISPYPGPSQNSSNIAAALDQFTGEISFTSFTQGEFVSVIKVEEYRCGILIGEVYRELQTILTGCGANNPPTADPPIQDSIGNFSFNDTVLAGAIVTFDFYGVDIGDTLTLTTTSIQYGTNYASPNGCANPPCAMFFPPPIGGLIGVDSVGGLFYWETSCNNISFTGGCEAESNTYLFIFTIQDGACPSPGQVVSTVAITVLSRDPIESPNMHCTAINPANGDVTLYWDTPLDTGGVFNSYHLFSSTNPNGPFTIVDSIFNYNQNIYTHIGANAHLDTTYYIIQSRSGCSGMVFNPPKDTIATIFLKTEDTTGVVNLDWNAVHSPLLGSSTPWYRIYKEYPIGTWALLDSTQNLFYVDSTYDCSDSITYYIEIDDSLTCTSRSNYSEIRYQNPIPSAEFAFSVACLDDTTTFSDSSTIADGSVIGWDWNFGDGDTSILQNPTHVFGTSGTQNVTLIATSDYSCVDSITKTVNVNNLPIVIAWIDTAICFGDSAQLTASGALSYVWSPSAGLNDDSIFNPIATPSTTTTYIVTGTDANGCSDTADVTITVNPLPVINTGGTVQFCNGDSVQLSSGIGISYSWSPSIGLSDTAVANPYAKPTDTTVYYVTVTDANSCSNNDSVTVINNSLPFADAGSNDTICNQDTAAIGGSPTGPTGATYSWTPTAGLDNFSLANPNAFPSDTTTYYVIVTDTNGCQQVDSVAIIVNPLPLANAGSDVQICIGDTTQLNATGGSSYVWMPNDSLSDDSISNPFAWPTDTTDYIVTVTNTNGCVLADTVTVTVNPLPIVSAGADVQVCITDSVQLNATGGITYSWSPSNGLSDTAIANPYVNFIDTNIYYVTVTDTNGCVNVDSVVVTVNPLPSITAGPGGEICLNDSIQLNAAGGSIYAWTPPTGLSDDSISNPFASPLDTTTYTVTVTDTNGCINQDSGTIIVNPLPIVDAGSDTAICIYDTVAIGGSPTGPVGSTYSWSPSARLSDTALANPNAFPLVTTTYVLIVVDSNGCIGQDSITITVNPLPNANAGLDLWLCPGDSIQLNATGGNVYNWFPADSVSNDTISNPYTSALDTTEFIVTVTDTNGCVNTDTMLLDVGPTVPTDAGANVQTCIGDTLQIGGSPTAPAGSSFEWSPSVGLNDTSLANPVAFPSDTTTYYVTATNSTCTGNDSVMVTVNPLPVANAGNDVQICIGDTTQLTATGGQDYVWMPNDSLSDDSISNPLAWPLDTAIYTVMVTDSNGCVNYDSVTITVNPLPLADAGTDVQICIFDTTPLVVTGGQSYVWIPNDSLSDDSISNPLAWPTDTTTYAVMVTDSNGCVNYDSVTITVNPLPVADAGTNVQICIFDTTQLVATSGQSYVWMPNDSLSDDSISNPLAWPTDTTTYTVMVTDSNGCVNYDSVTITVNSLPNADAGTDVQICIFDTIQLIASGGQGYVWTPLDSLSDDSVSSPLAWPSDTTTYTVMVTDSNSCINYDSVTITVNPLPVADAGTSVQICIFDTIQLIAIGGQSYVWTPNDSLSDDSISNPLAWPSDTTTYAVMVTDSNGCINYDSVTVTVNPLPVIDAGTDTAICIYDTISIGGSPTGPSGSSYSWNTTVTLSDSTLANPQVYPTSNTTYYLTVSDSNNCVSYDSIRVDVNSLPTVNAGADIQVCIFDSVQLNVTGGSSYIWTPATGLNDDSIANPLASPSDTTTYIVTGTDSNTCKNTDTVTVVVNPLPNANAGAGVQICIYDTIQLIATGGEIYNWLPMDSLSDNSNDTTLAWPTDTTSYVVTVTDSNTCVNTDTVVVTVNPLPVIDAGTDTAICIFDSIVIGGSPTGPVGSVYSWLPNDSIITTTSQNPIVFPTSTTEYFLVVNDSNGCVNDDSISITVNNLPVIDAGNDVQVCIYDSVQLNATGGIIYVWTPDIGLSDDSIADPLVSPSDTTMYYVTGADSNTCSNVDSVTVIVNPLPPADAGNDVQICLGDTTQLNATGGIIYAWLPDTMLSDDSVSNPFAFPLDTTDYVVTVTDTNSCENTDTVTITVNPLPLTDAGIDTAICIGDTFLIGGSPTGPAGSSFEWMPSEGLGDTISANPPASPDTTTKYFVIATDSNGCILTDSVLITVNYLPIAYAGADTQICIYDTVQLNATGGIVYLWSPADSINDTAAFNPLVWPSDTMEYVVLVTDSNGCMNIDSVVVVVNPLPNADAGADEYICRSDSITLTATGGESYSWSPATEIANPDSSSPTVFPQIPTTYFVEVTDSNSCRNTDSVSVNVFRIFGGDTSICENATIVLGLNSTGIPFSYLWSPAIYLNDSSLANPTASPDEEGDITYTVIVNDSGICVDSTEVNLTIHIQPSANFSVTYIPQCDEVSGEFINSSIDADWYHWDFGTADTANTTDADYDFSYQGTPSVTLIAYNQYCSDTIESDSTLQSFIEYLDVTVSNVFSPNNDGINDYFAVGVNPSLIECTKLQIYNRWGQLMFIDTEGVKMWDGKNIFNGRNVPAGVYYYVFSINDLPPINGSVTVNY